MTIAHAEPRHRLTPHSYNRSLWFILGALVVISLLHYLTDIHLIPYHSIYRSLYYVPIAIAAVRYGRRGGMLAALLATVLYLPHVVMAWSSMPSDALNDLLETVVFLFVGTFAGSLADAERRQRQRAQDGAAQLAEANAELQRQAELAERMRASVASILESIDSGVVTIDHAGQVTTTNPAAQRLLGTIGTNAATLPDRAAHYYTTGSRGYTQFQHNGRTLGLHGSPLIGSRHEQIGTVLVVEDQTEHRMLEEQVQRAQRLAALGRLAGGLAHEIRNPLGIVRASAQMLQQQLGADAALGEYTQVIQAEIDRVDRLIEQLLTYARPPVVQRGSVAVGELVDRTVTLVHAYAAQRQVQLRVANSLHVPDINADRELLMQALVNLTLNAIQATAQHGVVELSIAMADKRGQHIQIMVKDTGRGIAPSNMPRIFDPFFTTRDDGTGLGLSIVQQIVEQHSGSISATSELGQGACFVITLPIADAGAEA